MSAGVPQPDEPPAVRIESQAPVEPRGRVPWGVISFVLAILVFLMEPAVNSFVNTAGFLSQASTISGTAILIQFFAVLGVWALALLAVRQRRGTRWAVAAVTITIAGNGFIQSTVRVLFDLVFTAVFGTPAVRY